MDRLTLPRPRALATLLGATLLACALIATPAFPLDTAPAPAQDGAVWPLEPQPQVVSGFDPPSSAWGAGHRGVDLAGAVGQPVRAARDGTVTFAGRLAGRGVVAVSHGATRTTYEPVAASVSAGDRVRAGTVIGRLELLGSHCLPQACLHWGLLEGDRYLDPLTLVGGGPVRLLPWLPEGTGMSLRVGPASPTVPLLPGWQPMGRAALFRR